MQDLIYYIKKNYPNLSVTEAVEVYDFMLSDNTDTAFYFDSNIYAIVAEFIKETTD
jgi:hypothetical protein